MALKRKTIIYFFIPAGLLILVILAFLFGHIETYHEQQNARMQAIKLLQYNAIEANGARYYPISVSVLQLPVSLPPQGSTLVYKVVNDKTDYAQIYPAKTFVDDYDQNYLFMDGLVFEKGKFPARDSNNAAHAAYGSAMKIGQAPVQISDNPKIPYAYYDINGDGIDELIQYPGTGADSYDIYTYKNGKIVQLIGIGQSYENLKIYPKTHVVYFPGNGHMGYYYDTYYQLHGAKATVAAEKSWTDATASHPNTTTFYVKGKAVSREQYMAYTEKLRRGKVVSNKTINWRELK